jgi:Asp-tRNA(Asn)/Glu-tRNA(Gln) amidotransferase C subunit
VSELDLSGVGGDAAPARALDVWAEDEPAPSLPVEDALANAPDREDDLFRVPAA